MKKTFYTELAYLLGTAVLALGTAMMERADFGVSMVVAPAYLLHLKLSRYFSFFTFGMAEYILQAALIAALAVVQRKLKKYYLFSFVTAVLYGTLLDGAIWLISRFAWASMASRILCYGVGMVLCSTGVALLFRTYVTPGAYELFVKEISNKLNMPIGKFKTIYDCTSCVISILLSFLFFGLWHFEGIKLGTIICSLLNGWLIVRITALSEKAFSFCDALPLRKYFE